MCLLCVPLQADTTAMGSSTVGFQSLVITPAAGAFSFDGPWFLQGFAHADNSLGESADQLSPNIPPDFLATSPATISAAAAVTWASAQGAASAPNTPPDLAVTGSAHSSVNVPGCGPAAAFSKGRGTLFNSFILSGGGSNVNVQFAIDIAGALNLLTDGCGVFARTQTVFTLQVDGEVVLFDDRLREIGRSDALTEQFSEHLTATVPLETLDAAGLPLSHVLLLEADSESSGLVSVPEPPAGLLLIAGLAVLGAARRRPVLARLGK